jgi:uncharacterized damage-inducible protein DinB
MPQPEPWLRGTHTDLSAVLRAVVHALELARENVDEACAPLPDEALHARPGGVAPIGFHLRHIPRSLDRLLTYAEGNQLSSEQIAALKTELDPADAPHPSREQLFSEFEQGIAAAADRVRAFVSADLDEPRGVGKKQLPTSVGGLLVHLADHTQRHTGQIVTTAKVLLNSR